MEEYEITYAVKKKQKKWKDGKLSFHPSSHKLVLYDDKGKVLDQHYDKRRSAIQVGDDMEWPHYILSIEGSLSQPSPPTLPSSQPPPTFRRRGLSKRSKPIEPPPIIKRTKVNPTTIDDEDPFADTIIHVNRFNHIVGGVGSVGEAEVDTNPPTIPSKPTPLRIWKHDKIRFPERSLCNTLRDQYPSVSTEIPIHIPSLRTYVDLFSTALREEMNFRLLDIAIAFHKQCDMMEGSGEHAIVPPTCPHGKAVLYTVKKEGPNQGKAFYCCGLGREKGCKLFHWKEAWVQQHPPKKTLVRQVFKLQRGMEPQFSKVGVPLYVHCVLERKEVPINPWSGKGGITRYFLKLPFVEHHSKYGKADLWVISTSSRFTPKTKEDFVCIMESVYFGPSDKRLEVKAVHGKPRNVDSIAVYAIRGPSASTSFMMLDMLGKLDASMPFLPTLLGRKPSHKPKPLLPGLPLEDIDIDAMCEAFIGRYHLNEDQGNVIRKVSDWFHTHQSPEVNDVELVHGVFGAGKSTILVVLVLFLRALGQKMPSEGDTPGLRVMIAASTNAAVDRILEGLLDRGCEDFMRVGSIRKVSKRVLHLVPLYGKNVTTEEQEIQQMIQEHGGTPELHQALLDVKSGLAKERSKLVQTAPIIGTTCVASTFEVLRGCTFDVLILDESSQMVEPLSLLPLGRFGCRKVVAVGDPLQLSPVMDAFVNEEAAEKGLGRPLFTRLAEGGHQPVLLRTQYRCHPMIGEIANRLFYDGQLLHGISATDRPPLIPGLDPIIFKDTSTCQESVVGRGGAKSYRNVEEAALVARHVSYLVKAGCAPGEIGVIALYKGQVGCIEGALQGEGVKVSTVDAFQGSEREVIVLSCTRSSKAGFIDAKKRMNVALTRARSHLIIYGSRAILESSVMWKQVLDYIPS